MSTQAKDQSPAVLVTTSSDGIRTIQMNRPKSLNAWTRELLPAVQAALTEANLSADVRAIVLVGSGRFYCAGVDLASTIAPMHPRTLHKTLVESNKSLFDQYIDSDKPIFIAANGPAVGASVTSASLSDGIVAHESAYFWTPFKALGIVPEGCSSFYFEHRFGKEFATEMLEKGTKMKAKDMLQYGYVTEMIPKHENPEKVLEVAQAMALEFVNSGKTRLCDREPGLRAKLKEVNAKESVALADAFLSEKFLEGMMNQMYNKGQKSWMAVWLLKNTRPIWSRL